MATGFQAPSGFTPPSGSKGFYKSPTTERIEAQQKKVEARYQKNLTDYNVQATKASTFQAGHTEVRNGEWVTNSDWQQILDIDKEYGTNFAEIAKTQGIEAMNNAIKTYNESLPSTPVHEYTDAQKKLMAAHPERLYEFMLSDEQLAALYKQLYGGDIEGLTEKQIVEMGGTYVAPTITETASTTGISTSNRSNAESIFFAMQSSGLIPSSAKYLTIRDNKWVVYENEKGELKLEPLPEEYKEKVKLTNGEEAYVSELRKLKCGEIVSTEFWNYVKKLQDETGVKYATILNNKGYNVFMDAFKARNTETKGGIWVNKDYIKELTEIGKQVDFNGDLGKVAIEQGVEVATNLYNSKIVTLPNGDVITKKQFDELKNYDRENNTNYLAIAGVQGLSAMNKAIEMNNKIQQKAYDEFISTHHKLDNGQYITNELWNNLGYSQRKEINETGTFTPLQVPFTESQIRNSGITQEGKDALIKSINLGVTVAPKYDVTQLNMTVQEIIDSKQLTGEGKKIILNMIDNGQLKPQTKIDLTLEKVINSKGITDEGKQLVLNQISKGAVATSEIMPTGVLSAAWQAITPWSEEKGETLLHHDVSDAAWHTTKIVAPIAAVVVASVIFPPAALIAGVGFTGLMTTETVLGWKKMSNMERGFMVAMDVIGAALLISPIKGTVRNALPNKSVRVALTEAKNVQKAQYELTRATKGWTGRGKSILDTDEALISDTVKSTRYLEAVRKVKLADEAFYKALSSMKNVTPKQLTQLEELTGIKGLKGSVNNLWKVQKKINEEWVKYNEIEAEFKRYTTGYAKSGVKLTDTGIDYPIKLAKQITKIQELTNQRNNLLNNLNNLMTDASGKLRPLTPESISGKALVKISDNVKANLEKAGVKVNEIKQWAKTSSEKGGIELDPEAARSSALNKELWLKNETKRMVQEYEAAQKSKPTYWDSLSAEEKAKIKAQEAIDRKNLMNKLEAERNLLNKSRQKTTMTEEDAMQKLISSSEQFEKLPDSTQNLVKKAMNKDVDRWTIEERNAIESAKNRGAIPEPQLISKINKGKQLTFKEPNPELTRLSQQLRQQQFEQLSKFSKTKWHEEYLANLDAEEQSFYNAIINKAIPVNPSLKLAFTTAIKDVLGQKFYAMLTAYGAVGTKVSDIHILDKEIQGLAKLLSDLEAKVGSIQKFDDKDDYDTFVNTFQKEQIKIKQAIKVKMAELTKTLVKMDITTKTKVEQAIKVITDTTTEVITVVPPPSSGSIPPFEFISTPPPSESILPIDTGITEIKAPPFLWLPEVDNNKKILAFPDGTITWKQGIFWKVIPPPWTQDKPISLRKPPEGAKLGGKTPRETIQMIGAANARIPKEFSIDLGVTDIYVTNHGKNIKFKGHGTKTSVGKNTSSKTSGMSQGISVAG